jgi:diketogulonate reductase-like aldo/keto reductase
MIGATMPSSHRRRRRNFFPVVLPTLLLIATKTSGLSFPIDNGGWSRRDVVVASLSAASSVLLPLTPALAAETASIETIDMDAIYAARAKGPDLGTFMNMDLKKSSSTTGSSATSDKGGFDIFGGREQVSIIRPNVILAQRDPPPLLRMGPKPQLQIPRVGYSLYKTPSDQVSRAVSLALRSGVRHFDVATQYGSNKEFAKAVSTYLDSDVLAINLSDETPELLAVLDKTRRQGEDHAAQIVSSNSYIGMGSGGIPTPAGKLGRKARRDGLFVSHKLSNEQQSSDPIPVQRAIKTEIIGLGVQYLDLVSIHSPLTDSARRIETYKTLLELRDSGFVKSVGVCNYGVGALDEIEKAGLEFPCINQLELSPFNQHRDVVKWCQDRGVAIGCSAWSKLSSADGPQDGWAVVGDIAQKKGKTRAQILVRWSLQKGYVCVPRSSPSSKLERVAIAENSYGGVNHVPIGGPIGGEAGGFVLTDEEMMLLDGLDVGFKAGKLGRRDGWSDGDVTGPEWDPTDFV